MSPKKNTEEQTQMGLKFKGIPFLQRFFFRFRRTAAFFDQIKFWRSSALWLLFFINAALPILFVPWFYANLSRIPETLPILYYYHSDPERFIDKNFIFVILGITLLTQFVSVYISYKTFFKLRSLSLIIMILSALCAIIVYAGLYRSLTILIP